MKLFVTDLDGTLVEYNNITDENLEGINRLNASGELLAVATGRAYNSCTFLKEKYGVKVDYLILLNGGLIIDKDGKVVHHKEISYNTVKSIITDVKSDDSVISVETGYTSYVVHGRYKEDIDWNGLEYENLENIKDKNLSLISLYYPESDIEEVEKICRLINEKYSDEVVAYRNTCFIDVVPKGCSKGEGVNYVKERENIDTKDTYAIGDSYNDIPMFKEAGHSFTFETSEDGVKKEVKYIVNSVAEAIKKYCLK